MSKFVKIVIATEHNFDEDYCTTTILRAGITDWEEVSDDDYTFLQRNIHKIYQLIGKDFGYGSKPFLLVQDNKSISDRLESVKELVEKERKRIEADEKKRLKAKQEKALKKKVKTEAEERELLKRLQEKFSKS